MKTCYVLKDSIYDDVKEQQEYNSFSHVLAFLNWSALVEYESMIKNMAFIFVRKMGYKILIKEPLSSST